MTPIFVGMLDVFCKAPPAQAVPNLEAHNDADEQSYGHRERDVSWVHRL